jgi:hypothetical protein
MNPTPTSGAPLLNSTIVGGVPDFLVYMAGIWAVAYFAFMRDKR